MQTVVTGFWVVRNCHTGKKEKKIFLIYLEISEGSRAKSYITNDLLIYAENICAFPHILGSSSSYMTLHLMPSKFHYIWGKFCFPFFYRCKVCFFFYSDVIHTILGKNLRGFVAFFEKIYDGELIITVISNIGEGIQYRCVNEVNDVKSVSQPDSTVCHIWKPLLFANNRNRVRRVVLSLSQDGACPDLFENLSERE